MVSRAHYDEQDEPSFRRYSSRGHGYPLSYDRELPPAPSPYNREHHLSHHETRGGNNAQDDNSSRPRSRIPVACGRCRKRKIRCSGDLGTGLPCTNCKSAGNDNCQFLRVSSHEASLKNEPTDFSNFEAPPPPPSAAARLQCRSVPYGHHTYVQQLSAGLEGYYPRNSSLSGYQYPPAKYYAMAPSYQYSDDNVEYDVQGSYALGSEQLLSNISISNANRAWTPNSAQLSRNATATATATAPMYLEQVSTYNHGQLPYHTYPLRPTITPDVKPASISSQILPLNGTDRVLPFPAANRPQVGSYLRTNANGLPNAENYHSYDGLVGSTLAKSLNSSAVSDNGSLSTSYMSYSSSSPESLASTNTAYSSQTQQPSDLYSTSNEGLFHSNESADSSYGPSSTAKRGSQSSQGGQGTMASLSNSSLANGHAYTPYISPASYPAPPMDLHSHAASQARRVSTSISAA